MTKNNRLFACLGLVGVALLACLGGAVAVYLYFANQPPSALDASGYFVRGGRVYYHPGFPDEAFVIPAAYAASFTILDQSYARDRRQVYFRGQTLPGADVGSWQLLDAVADLSHDQRQVYRGAAVISADPAHYELLGGPLAKDSQHVYWADRVLSDDPAHFVVFPQSSGYWYAHDAQTVFVQGNPIAGADPATFQVIQEDYARDARRLYYFDQVLSGADPATFQVLASPYARDARAVYWMEHAIAGADPRTFQILNLAFQCAADAQHAYYHDQAIAHADPRTFPSGQKVTNCTATEIFFAH